MIGLSEMALRLTDLSSADFERKQPLKIINSTTILLRNAKKSYNFNTAWNHYELWTCRKELYEYGRMGQDVIKYIIVAVKVIFKVRKIQ